MDSTTEISETGIPHKCHRATRFDKLPALQDLNRGYTDGMREIIHQKQTALDCVCTCIAMLAGRPRREIAARFHAKYLIENTMNISDILWALQINYRECRQEETAVRGKLYLANVPSLNREGWTHLIIIDFRNNTLKLYDPNQGVTGRRYYVSQKSPKHKNQVAFHGYHVEYEIQD